MMNETPTEAAVPSPSVEEARLSVYDVAGRPERALSSLYSALDALVAAVRREEQEVAEAKDERVRVRARDALASALTRAESAEARVQGLEDALRHEEGRDASTTER